jgi:hypothetical protein
MARWQSAGFGFVIHPAIRLTLLLACISLAQAHAQTGQPQGHTTGTDAPRHEVSGTVVNSVTGAPISRALVELATHPPRHMITDVSGAFRFEGVAEGSVNLEAERPGFFKPTEVPSKQNLTSSFQVSGDVDGIVLKLVPQGDISGRVRSIQGLPIQGFPVRVYERTIVNGAVQWQKIASLTCGEDGLFRVFGLAEGSFVVSAGPELWRPRPPGSKHLGYPLVFYPNVHEFSSASVLTVTAGEHVEADFSLSQEPLFEISGGVIGVPDEIDTKIELRSSAGDPVPLVQRHPERHEFQAYVTAGRYTLRASAEVGQSRRATIPLNIDSNIAGIQVALGPQLTIPVNLRAELANTSTDKRTNALNASVTLTSTSSPLSPIGLSATRVAGREQGVMEIAGAEADSYSVEITPYNACVGSATSGATDLLQSDLLVPEDGRVAPIEIELRGDGGEVGGNVKLPDPGSSATVLLIPERGSSREIRSLVVAEATGLFHFDQVCPGSYTLLALDRVENLEYRNPEVLGSYLSSGTHMTVAPRQSLTANLELIPFDK